MIYLPDVNIWLALACGSHVHHKAAATWFDTVGDEAAAFCRVTQMGLLRLLTNATVMADDVRTASSAWRVLDTFHQDARVVFRGEPPGLEEEFRRITAHSRMGANFWTDAYLAAFTRLSGSTLVSFDRAFRRAGVDVCILGSS